MRGPREDGSILTPTPARLDDGQQQAGRVAGAVVDGVGAQFAWMVGVGPAPVGEGLIPVDDIEPDAVARQEPVGGGMHLDLELVDLTRGRGSSWS